jgi:hypothetical protein
MEQMKFLNNETRRRRLQIRELDARIDWLNDYIERFDPKRHLEYRVAHAQSCELVAAWTIELAEKRQLKLDLAEGRSVSQAEIDAKTPIVPILKLILKRFAAPSGRGVRENAMQFGKRR